MRKKQKHEIMDNTHGQHPWNLLKFSESFIHIFQNILLLKNKIGCFFELLLT